MLSVPENRLDAEVRKVPLLDIILMYKMKEG